MENKRTIKIIAIAAILLIIVPQIMFFIKNRYGEQKLISTTFYFIGILFAITITIVLWGIFTLILETWASRKKIRNYLLNNPLFLLDNFPTYDVENFIGVVLVRDDLWGTSDDYMDCADVYYKLKEISKNPNYSNTDKEIANIILRFTSTKSPIFISTKLLFYIFNKFNIKK